MLENLYLLIELVTALIVLWALHGSRKRPGIYTIIFICISLIIENAILLGLISNAFFVIIYFGYVLLNTLEFKDSMKNAIFYGLFDMVIIFILQYIIGMFFTIIFNVSFFGTVELLVVQCLMLAFVIIMYLKIDFSKVCKIFLNNNIVSLFILIFLGAACIIYTIQSHVWDTISWENIVYVAIFFIVVLILVFEWQRENNMSKQKSAELELFQQYNSIYQDFILDMRKKQHDFDNHLQAIFSMNATAADLNSLVNQQNRYCEELLEDNRDSIFLKEDVNSVYLAFLYTKKKKAEEFGIEVRYRFDCHDIESKLPFIDFITVLGNLLDNAVEAVKNEEHKIILLDILQSETSILIRVCNTYSFSEGEIPADFFCGKSKKGEEHGLGLSNVTDVVKRYHGIIENNFEYMEQEKFYKISLQLFGEKE